MKGISPLIASVILIAVTLAIAGILATFAFQFVGGRQAVITQQAECLGALDVDSRPPSLTYSGTTFTMVLFNIKSTLTLQNLTAFLTMPTDVQSYNLGVTLGPRGSQTVNIPGVPTKPLRVRVSSMNCEGFLADLAVP